MNIRVGKNLLEKLRKASEKYGASYSVIARKALRKFGNDPKTLEQTNTESTYTGESIRFDLNNMESCCRDAKHLRICISCYLKQFDLSKPLPASYQPREIEGIDYKVKNSE